MGESWFEESLEVGYLGRSNSPAPAPALPAMGGMKAHIRLVYTNQQHSSTSTHKRPSRWSTRFKDVWLMGAVPPGVRLVETQDLISLPWTWRSYSIALFHRNSLPPELRPKSLEYYY